MLKLLLATLVSFSILAGFSGATLDPVSCFDHYKYGAEGVFLHFAPEKVQYNAGDTIRVPFTLQNTFGIPIVDGNVKIVVVYKGLADTNNVLGDEIVDEFFVDEDVNLQPDGMFDGRAVWVSNKDLPEGVYAFNAYLTQGKKFNLKGLSFTTSTPGATSTFKLKSGGKKHASFDKSNIIVNGQSYSDRNFVPFVLPTEDVKISARVNGLADKITAELFSWDTNLASNKISEREITGTSVNYNLGKLADGVYLVQLTAYSGESKSIQWIRLAVEGVQGRIVHMGLSEFPVTDGTADLHICLQNSPTPSPGGTSFMGSGEITIKDSSGKVIAKENFDSVETTPYPIGLLAKVNLPKDSKLTVDAVLKDEKGKVQDNAHLVYDLSAFAGIARNIAITAPAVIGPGERMTYSVSYKDGGGNDLSGKLFVTVEDSSGVVLLLAETSANSQGSLDTAELARGSYTLKVVDGSNGVSKQMAFTVGDKPAQKPASGEQPAAAGGSGFNSTTMAIILIVVLAAIAGAIFMLRRK